VNAGECYNSHGYSDGENSLYYGDKLNLSCYQKVKDICVAGELDQGRSCRVGAHCVLPSAS